MSIVSALIILNTSSVFAASNTPDSQIANNPKAQLSPSEKAKSDAKQKEARLDKKRLIKIHS